MEIVICIVNNVATVRSCHIKKGEADHLRSVNLFCKYRVGYYLIMAAESPRRLSKTVGTIARPLPVSDKTVIESVVDFIHDVVPQSYTGSSKTEEKDTITWVKFAYADVNENSTAEHKSLRRDGSAPPLLLVLGYANGVQVWTIPANGEAQEVLSWRQGAVKTFAVLPTPVPVGSGQDLFLNKRPLVAMCDNPSPGQQFCGVSFASLKSGDLVHTIKFKNPICNIYCNKKVIVLTFQERIAVFDACTFKDRFTITSCYPSAGPNLNPIALGSHWLAYSDQKLVSVHQTCGGVAGYGIHSYTATVIHAAKSLTKGLAMFGETVASSLTGSSKPSHGLTKKETYSGEAGGQTQGIVTIVDVINVGEGEVNVNEENGGEGIVAHFVAHVNGPVAAMQFDSSGVLLVTADRAGHNFHVFRILPHPSCSSLGAVHHLYTLYRGDTTAKVQDITLSVDSRWIAVSTLRGTTHIFPITPYGGPVTLRTHSSPRVVNRLSRFHKSAGLEDIHQPSTTGRSSPVLTGSPSSSGLGHPGGPGPSRTYDSHPSISYHSANSSRMGNPRLPPYPHPTVVTPLAQIRQSTPFAGFAYSGGTRSPPARGAKTHHTTSYENVSVAAVFATQRSWLVGSPGITKDKGEKRPVDSLYIVGCNGTVIEYCLEPRVSSGAAKQTDESPIDLEVQPRAQWHLNRLSSSPEVKPPLSSTNPLIIAQEFLHSHNDPPSGSGRSKTVSSSTLIGESRSELTTEDERWLSQVEIITYAGPHRRLWMGPQFTFKPFQHPANTTILSATSSALLGQGHESTSGSGVGGGGASLLMDEFGAESLGSRITARSTPVAMPTGARHGLPLLIEAGSGSFEQSPGMLELCGYSSWPDSLTGAGISSGPSSSTSTGVALYHQGVVGLVCLQPDDVPNDEQLRESLADAMLESPSRTTGCGGGAASSSSTTTASNIGATSATAADPADMTSQQLLGGRSVVGNYGGGSGMGGNSGTLLTWNTNTGSSEELSTSSSQSGSASQMSDAPVHTVDHLMAFPGTTTPPPSSPVLGRTDSHS